MPVLPDSSSSALFSVPSIIASGTLNAPGATTNVCSTTPPAGRYRVEFIHTVTGAVEVLPMNMRLVANAAQILTLPTGAGVGAFYSFQIENILLDGVNVLAIGSVAAATALTVYSASYCATRLA